MRKNIAILLLYLFIFAAIFGLSVFDYLHNRMIFDLGFSAKIANLTIIVLSSLSILKTAWHIYSY